jgi:hypothetical protein
MTAILFIHPFSCKIVHMIKKWTKLKSDQAGDHHRPNPAFLSNRCDTFLALNARRVSDPQFDDSEDIAVAEAPIAEIPQMIQSGQITHALVIAAFYHYERYISAA